VEAVSKEDAGGRKDWEMDGKQGGIRMASWRLEPFTFYTRPSPVDWKTFLWSGSDQERRAPKKEGLETETSFIGFWCSRKKVLKNPCTNSYRMNFQSQDTGVLLA